MSPSEVRSELYPRLAQYLETTVAALRTIDLESVGQVVEELLSAYRDDRRVRQKRLADADGLDACSIEVAKDGRIW